MALGQPFVTFFFWCVDTAYRGSHQSFKAEFSLGATLLLFHVTGSAAVAHVPRPLEAAAKSAMDPQPNQCIERILRVVSHSACYEVPPATPPVTPAQAAPPLAPPVRWDTHSSRGVAKLANPHITPAAPAYVRHVLSARYTIPTPHHVWPAPQGRTAPCRESAARASYRVRLVVRQRSARLARHWESNDLSWDSGWVPCRIPVLPEECVDTQNDLESCGGCKLSGLGQTDDRPGRFRPTDKSRCTVLKCIPEYEIHHNRTQCVESPRRLHFEIQTTDNGPRL
ncbi:hypothetical protein R3P38DRAFT_3181149 [Favolaschia claudopus]|uniref:Protein CPL1-like domain-containing protein n=1 Tax=Favolaschia claudopus TaxID=2862362 RepID=A0AAW0CLJ6_9AGAR